jgi:beta-galactosidase
MVNEIKFDKYSYIINGKREFIRSAAIHYFRLPGEKTWIDRITKLQAAGYNTIDMYLNWGYHSKAPGQYDFSGIKDIKNLLQIAQDMGLYIVCRPGPYINAEVSGGGFPNWLLARKDIILRNRKDNDYVYSPGYMEAIKEWYETIIPIINQFPNVITVQIENEYSTNELENDYMLKLKQWVRELGCKLPIMHNDMYSAGLYADIVDIYAIDNYSVTYFSEPWQSFPEVFAVLDLLEENVREFKDDAPIFIAELQAGWFDKWGGMGYDKMRNALGRNHLDIVTKTAIARGVTGFTHYMGAGGTNWGHLGSTEVYTSYDFASPITEEGLPTNRFYQARNINNILRSFDLSKTELATNQPEITCDNRDAIVTYWSRTNLIDNSRWLFVRNDSIGLVKATINGEYSIEIDPQEMLILPSDLRLNEIRVNYSTIPLWVRINDKHNQVLFPKTNITGEINLTLPENSKIKVQQEADNITIEHDTDRVKIILNETPSMTNPAKVTITTEQNTSHIVFLPQAQLDYINLRDNNVIVGPAFITQDNNKLLLAGKKNLDWMTIDLSGNIEKIPVQAPEKVENIQLSKWQSWNIAQEIEKETENWKEVDSTYLDSDFNGIYGDFFWYQTEYEGNLHHLEINARHCYAVYLNGKEIYARDSFENVSGIDETPPDVIPLSADMQKEKNKLVLLIQSMGHNKGFEDDAANPRGLLSYATTPEKVLKWQIKKAFKPEDLQTETMNQTAKSATNKYVVCAVTKFNFSVPENHQVPLGLVFKETTFNKANIYLNDVLIGHYWRDKGPQNKFYLPETFYNQDGQPNTIKLLIWNRSIDNNTNYTSLINNDNIYIEPYDVFRLTELEELI